MLLETLLIYHISQNITTSKTARIKCRQLSFSKCQKYLPLPKGTSCHGQLISLFCFSVLLAPLIFTHILSESLKLMVYAMTNTLEIVNEHKKIPQSSLAHGCPHPHLPPLSIPLLLQPGIKIELGPTSAASMQLSFKSICSSFVSWTNSIRRSYVDIKCA